MVEPLDGEPVVPSPAGRLLGEGRHPIASTQDRLAVAFVEVEAELPRVGLQLLEARGARFAQMDVSVGGTPTTFANPVVAGLPDDFFAVAFNDLNSDGSELGVALRRVSSDGSVGPLGYANQTTQGAQYDADLIWTGSELIAAWTDTSDPVLGPDVRARRFNAQLEPTSDEFLLGGSDLPEGNVTLVPFGESWAAAWREAQADGSDVIVVFSEGASWRLPSALPGPFDDRPALIALDDEHLFVAYTVGTDPWQTGVANTPRLYAAVISVVGDTVLEGPEPVEPLDPEYAGTSPEQLELGQSQPAAVAAGERLFLAWRSEGLLGDGRGEQLWLKRIYWDGASRELSLEVSEVLLPRNAAPHGDQRAPALAATPLVPEGALFLAWTDYGENFHSTQGRPDIALQLAPLPMRRGPPLEWACASGCGAGQGPCDPAVGTDCVAGTVCVAGRGPWYGYGPSTPVCTPAHCTNGVEDGHLGETGVDCGGSCGLCFECPRLANDQPDPSELGRTGFCNSVCPCKAFEGDCNSDHHCRGQLVCAEDMGESRTPPFHPLIDICIAPQCTDGIKNGQEERVDCGGPDCPSCQVGTPDFCAQELCTEGQGHCASDDECVSGLLCAANEGARYGLEPTVSVCVPAGCATNPAAPDDPDYCIEECRCGSGMGGCTHDNQCVSGLVCAPERGLGFGKPADLGICVPAHCTNLVFDGDETNFDCGGSCGACPVCVTDERFASFEDPDRLWDFAPWITPGANSVFQSTHATHGSESFALTACGWTEVNSALFSTTSFGYVGDQLWLDVYIPESVPNIWWVGDMILHLSIPGVADRLVLKGRIPNGDGFDLVDQVSLTNLTRGAWNTMAFAVPSHIEQAFHQVHTGAQFALDISLATCASGQEPTFLFDHLRFAGDLSERSLCDDEGTGSGGTGGTSGTGGTGGTGGTSGASGSGGTGGPPHNGGTGGDSGGTGGDTGSGASGGGSGGSGGSGGAGGSGTGGSGTGGSGTGGAGATGGTGGVGGAGTFIEELFSFDDASLWSSPQYTPALDTSHVSQGSAALSVPFNQWVELLSAPFSTTDLPHVEAFALDLYIPEPLNAASWDGQVDVFLECPSASLWGSWVGWASLQDRNWNLFNTIGFSVPEQIRTVLGGSYSDCRMRLTFSSWGASETSFAIDNLRFQPEDVCATAQLSNDAPFILNQAVPPDGSAARPYPLCTAQQLQTVMDTPSLWDSHFELKRSLDVATLSGTIGNSTTPFRGTFHGGGHTLSNLTLAGTEEVGLFGRILGDGVLDGTTDGHVHDLTLSNPDVSGTSWTGALAGRVQGGRIERCRVLGGEVTATSQVGGLIGELSSGASLIEGRSSVYVSGEWGTSVGGLVGRVASSTVQQGIASGPVQGFGALAVGGLVGWSSGYIGQGSASGDASVSGPGLHVGGLLGRGLEGHVLVNSQSTGNVVAADASYVGGLVGMSAGDVGHAFAVGAVTGGIGVGGLIGSASGTVTRSYATGDVTGADVGGAFGLASGQSNRVFATGLVTATASGSCGGFVGTASGATASIADTFTWGDAQCGNATEAGGFAGIVSHGAQIARVYSRGTVSGSGDALGGFAGLAESVNTSVSASFFDASVNGGVPGVGVLVGGAGVSVNGVTTAELAAQGMYEAAGWDFVDVWMIDASGSVLR